jgi:hypothetical protein
MLLRVYLGVVAIDTNAVERLGPECHQGLDVQYKSAFVLMYRRGDSLMVHRDEQPLSGAVVSRANAAQAAPGRTVESRRPDGSTAYPCAPVLGVDVEYHPPTPSASAPRRCPQDLPPSIRSALFGERPSVQVRRPRIMCGYYIMADRPWARLPTSTGSASW